MQRLMDQAGEVEVSSELQRDGQARGGQKDFGEFPHMRSCVVGASCALSPFALSCVRRGAEATRDSFLALPQEDVVHGVQEGVGEGMRQLRYGVWLRPCKDHSLTHVPKGESPFMPAVFSKGSPDMFALRLCGADETWIRYCAAHCIC